MSEVQLAPATSAEWKQQLLDDVHELIVDDKACTAWTEEIRRWCLREKNVDDVFVADVEQWHDEKWEKEKWDKEAGNESSPFPMPFPVRKTPPLISRDPADDLDRLVLLAAFYNANREIRRFNPEGEASTADQRLDDSFVVLAGELRRHINAANKTELQYSLAVARKMFGSIEHAAPIGSASYLGNSRIKVGNDIVLLTRASEEKFIVACIENHGIASTAELIKSGVSNPSLTAKSLRELKNEILAPFIVPPKDKGDGYRVTLVDGHRYGI